MQQKDFETLKDFILQKNSYFSAGFANAFKDETTRTILVQDGSDMKMLLPNDTLGNYFYLRNDSSFSYDAAEAQRLADGGSQRLSFNDMILVYLVAVVKNADAYLLIENLRNTCMLYDDMNVQPVSSVWKRELVLIEELQKMKADDIAASLQRLKDETIVKISLAVSKLFIPANCIQPITA